MTVSSVRENIVLIRRTSGWEITEREASSEEAFLSRRTFLARAGLAAAAGMVLACGDRAAAGVEATIPKNALPFPFRRNGRYAIDRPLTRETVAASYNNFYEFTTHKDVWKRTGAFLGATPWTLEVTGMVHRPFTISVDELMRTMPMQERLYRHRCVEAWAMAVPWTGFPLMELLRRAEPAMGARYVRFLSFSDGHQQPAVHDRPWNNWPYYEGLRIDEAMNELAFLVTGVYGHALPKQHGAPLRLVVPWKYGYKSAKSIVRIEVTDRQPHTFWEDLAPNEYPFESNVDPSIPHPRWSQLTERMIGTFDVRRTVKYNGYGEWVRSMYEK